MKLLLNLLLVVFIGCSQPQEDYKINYSFPQEVSYNYGIKVTDNYISKDIQDKYEYWLNNYYEEQGDLARIKFDNKDYTVSEGIAYGMLIMVYMENEKNQTKSKFDKLWNYYKKFPANSWGFMNWKIKGFDKVIAKHGATDADVDMATALIMAYYQWGDNKYLEAGKERIEKIWKYEVENNYLKSGDYWSKKDYNPSYFSLAAFNLFSNYSDKNWSGLSDNLKDILRKTRNSKTGLVPDWCDKNGDPVQPFDDAKTYDKFGYDAVRTPWRLAWNYAWYGNESSKKHNKLIADWIKDTIPFNIGNGYNLNGSEYSDYTTATYMGSLACSGMVDKEYQDWLNNIYYDLNRFSKSKDQYYGTTLKILYMLLLTGNFPNLSEI